jgi:hypothetical protein
MPVYLVGALAVQIEMSASMTTSLLGVVVAIYWVGSATASVAVGRFDTYIHLAQRSRGSPHRPDHWMAYCIHPDRRVIHRRSTICCGMHTHAARTTSHEGTCDRPAALARVRIEIPRAETSAHARSRGTRP